MITQADIDEATELLANDSGITLVIRFKKKLYEKRVFINRHIMVGTIIQDEGVKFQVSDLMVWKDLAYCNRLTRKTFVPEGLGWSKVMTLDSPRS